MHFTCLFSIRLVVCELLKSSDSCRAAAPLCLEETVSLRHAAQEFLLFEYLKSLQLYI